MEVVENKEKRKDDKIADQSRELDEAKAEVKQKLKELVNKMSLA